MDFKKLLKSTDRFGGVGGCECFMKVVAFKFTVVLLDREQRNHNNCHGRRRKSASNM